MFHKQEDQLSTPIPKDLREDMQAISDEIADLMDELEELREDALDRLEACSDPGIREAITRIDIALGSMEEAADALEADED